MPIEFPQNYNPFFQRRISPFDNVQFGNNENGMNENPQNMMSQRTSLEDQYREGPMMSKYREFLSQGLPNRGDYSPSKMNRLGAALSGISVGAQGGPGFETARDQLDRPYNQAMMDRETRGKELSSGAKLEYDLNNERYNRTLEERRIATGEKNAESLASNRGSLSNYRTRRQDLQEKIANDRATDEEKQEYRMLQIELQNSGRIENTNAMGANRIENTNAAGRNRIENTRVAGAEARMTEADKQSGRMAIKQFQVDNPTFKIVKSEGGNYYAIDPKNPETIMDTGVSTEIGPLETTRVSELDESGNKLTTKTTRSRARVQNSSSRPKVGEVKTFPNGRKGRWDGKGWVAIQ